MITFWIRWCCPWNKRKPAAAERMSWQAGFRTFLWTAFPQNGVHAVQTDYEEGVRQALDYLWQVTGLPPLYLNMLPHDREPTEGDLSRLKTYKAWMLARGLRPQYRSYRQ
jgi:DNA-binding LacI/PurR family transcriptional regulator